MTIHSFLASRLIHSGLMRVKQILDKVTFSLNNTKNINEVAVPKTGLLYLPVSAQNHRMILVKHDI